MVIEIMYCYTCVRYPTTTTDVYYPRRDPPHQSHTIVQDDGLVIVFAPGQIINIQSRQFWI